MADAKHSGICILIVDDEKLNRELLRRALHRHYELEEAGDAEEAMAVLRRRNQDIRLVLSDQMMNGLSGTELATRARGTWPSIPFILVTAYEDHPEVVAAYRDQLIAAVIAKPWRGHELKALIAEHLEALLSS